MNNPTPLQIKQTKLSIFRNMKRLFDLLDEAERMQYERAPSPSSGVSRKGNSISDPTSDTALDPRRLNVRKARQNGLFAMRKLDATLVDAVSDLTRATKAWEGEGGKHER